MKLGNIIYEIYINIKVITQSGKLKVEKVILQVFFILIIIIKYKNSK